MEEKQLSHDESIRLINQMIGKAKNNVHDNGVGAIMWGALISFCALVTYAQIKFGQKLPFDIWYLAMLAVVPQIYFSVKKEHRMQVRSYDETALNYVWGVFGIGVFLLIFINSNVFSAANEMGRKFFDLTGQKSNFRFSEFSSAYFLMWYGMPGMITGGMKNFKPMLLGGIVCWVFAAIAVYTQVDIDMLLMAVGAICAWLIPGIILRKKYNVQMKAQHV